jgi:hypothetical protein
MSLAQAYAGLIRFLGDGTGASDTLLHVHAGMAILLAARILTRRSLASFVPLSVVCAAEFLNELLERIAYGSWRWLDTSSDFANTLFWPVVLMIGLRIRRSRQTVDAASNDGRLGLGRHPAPN